MTNDFSNTQDVVALFDTLEQSHHSGRSNLLPPNYFTPPPITTRFETPHPNFSSSYFHAELDHFKELSKHLSNVSNLNIKGMLGAAFLDQKLLNISSQFGNARILESPVPLIGPFSQVIQLKVTHTSHTT